jgi:hypothetical protein
MPFDSHFLKAAFARGGTIKVVKPNGQIAKGWRLIPYGAPCERHKTSTRSSVDRAAVFQTVGPWFDPRRV